MRPGGILRVWVIRTAYMRRLYVLKNDSAKLVLEDWQQELRQRILIAGVSCRLIQKGLGY